MTIVVYGDPRRRPARLSRDTTHVWTIRLDVPGSCAERLATLSVDERDRAARFRFERDRRRFVGARATLREILSRYLNTPAASVVFAAGPWGKPIVDPACHGTALRFNLSHAHELAVVAVAQEREVGVDVERLRALPDVEAIAARVFSPAERAGLDRLAADERLRAFFRLWTLKEAYVKGSGEGLGRPLEAIEVQLDADAQRARIRAQDRPDDDRRWELSSLVPGPGYIAAVALDAGGIQSGGRRGHREGPTHGVPSWRRPSSR